MTKYIEYANESSSVLDVSLNFVADMLGISGQGPLLYFCVSGPVIEMDKKCCTKCFFLTFAMLSFTTAVSDIARFDLSMLP